jgi:glycosyltransferase involved in cell wall biosynthesis
MKIVLVSYVFPPVGGAGVQRAVKLVKYLPDHGVEPIVLTTANPSVPLTDDSLVKDVPAGTKIVHARTLEPGYKLKQVAWDARVSEKPSLKARAKKLVMGAAKEALIPDAQVLWVPGASRALRRIIAEEKPHAVLISGPPFSSFLLGVVAKLGKETRLILDYRDEWTAYRVGEAGSGANFEMVPTVARRATHAIERRLLQMADGVVTATEAFRKNLIATFPFLNLKHTYAIPNGYDPDDIPSELPTPPSDKLVLAYAGTVFRLTSPKGLLGAVRRVHAREPELAKRLEVRFFGRIVDTETPMFEGMEALGVKRLGYIDHARVLPELASAHAVLCLLDAVDGAERIYPAKIFELMALGRPTLTLSPEGALTELVRAHELGDVIHPRDEEAIAAWLEQKLRAHAAGTLSITSHPKDVGRYHRRELAREFADVMRG